MNKHCHYQNCQQSVTVLCHLCTFCGWKYCLSHGLAEAHGCGEEAKKHARAEWMKTGMKQVTGQPKDKTLKESDKKYLHNKLKKQIGNSMSHQKKQSKNNK